MLVQYNRNIIRKKQRLINKAARYDILIFTLVNGSLFTKFIIKLRTILVVKTK